jgi:hypothetical protein
VTLTAALGACAGGSMAGSDTASEAEWRALRAPRPEPLAGAATVTVGDVQLLGAFPWPHDAVPAPLALSELVTTGLLRRRDVDFVERRRFAAAAAAERAGPRPSGQPPAGVSRSAEFQVQAVWLSTGAGSAVDVRLVRLESGEVAAGTRRALPSGTGAVRLARQIVAAATELLDEMGRLPSWTDPLGSANDVARLGVRPSVLDDFLRGLAAEERWRWEEARRGYQAARADPSFFEAAVALARTARLRLGGTLAES